MMPKKLPKLIALLISSMLMLSASGCASTSSYCLIAKPIVYEPADVDVMSDKLVDSILRHNEKYLEICGK